MPADQSGVIAYRIVDNHFEVLLITSIRTGLWIIPKGGLDEDLTSWESAQKEAFEEGGVSGDVRVQPFATYQYSKRGVTHTVEVFLMQVREVLTNYPESSLRKRKWITLPEVDGTVDSAELKRVIREAFFLLEGHPEKSSD